MKPFAPLKSVVVASLLSAWIGTTAVAHATSLSPAAAQPGAPSKAVVETSSSAHALSPNALLALGAAETRTGGTADDAARASLAARERAAPGLETFRGGDRYVYIGSSTALVLVIVLLIILL